MKKTVASAVLCCLLCLCAAPAVARADTNLNYHASVIVLTNQNTADNPKTASFTFYNTLLSDPSEYHIFYILAIGSGTVNLSVGPTSLVDLEYGIAGFLGLTPIAGVGLYGTPITQSAPVLFFGFGMIVMASHNAEVLIGLAPPYPAAFSMEAYFSETATTTTSI